MSGQTRPLHEKHLSGPAAGNCLIQLSRTSGPSACSTQSMRLTSSWARLNAHLPGSGSNLVSQGNASPRLVVLRGRK